MTNSRATSSFIILLLAVASSAHGQGQPWKVCDFDFVAGHIVCPSSPPGASAGKPSSPDHRYGGIFDEPYWEYNQHRGAIAGFGGLQFWDFGGLPSWHGAAPGQVWTYGGDGGGDSGPQAIPQAIKDVGPRASRRFAGPGQYPPAKFAAYGIVVFPTATVPELRGRRELACRAYWSNLPSSEYLPVPPAQQMVTVWPVNSIRLAADLNSSSADVTKICARAINGYDMAVAIRAIQDAMIAEKGDSYNDDGPYLFAWSPSKQMGKPDTLVLVANLSGDSTYAAFDEAFKDWKLHIEQDPKLWEHGWSVQSVRIEIRNWVDQNGERIASLIGH